jgi:hypothetical protein
MIEALRNLLREASVITKNGELEMEQKLVRTMELTNGLGLDFYDISRKLAGDRWYVGFIAQIDIALTDLLSSDQQLLDHSVDEVRAVLGETVSFQQKRDRHYIDEQDRDALLRELMDSFAETTLDYFSHPDFPGKYVLREFRVHLKQQSWRRNDNRG